MLSCITALVDTRLLTDDEVDVSELDRYFSDSAGTWAS